MKKKSYTCLSIAFLFLASSCGAENKGNLLFTTWEVPASFREERKDKVGKIETLTYTTKDYYLKSDKTEEKKLNVYLPYSYSEENQYDVLYLLHGTDKMSVDHINTWFKTIGIKNILDNLIAQEVIQPIIVVTPTFYSYGLYGENHVKNVKDVSPVKKNSSENFSLELRNDILPTVEGRYSTYADSTKESSFQTSRNHRAFAGLSNGCRIALEEVMEDSFDYFSRFGCYSSYTDAKELLSSLHQEKYQGLNLDYAFFSAGIYDFAYNGEKKMVKALSQDPLFKKDNLEFVKISFGYHSARSWRVGLFDTLLRFYGVYHD